MKQNNPWKRASILLGIVVLALIIADTINLVKERNDEELQKELKYESGKNFLDFAKVNMLEEVCNIDQRVCCNTKTGICHRV